MRVLIECEGDHARLTAVRETCSARQDAAHQDVARRGWSRAVDLCDQALRMVEGARAIDDDKARRLLVAVCQYETSKTALGIIDGFAQDSARELTETLRELGATMADVPSPETLVS